MSDLRLFLLIGVMGLAVYGIYRWVDSPDTRPVYRGPRPQPTIRFVPKGTPGAKTLEELRREQSGR